ncbi:STAS/SEC14 domain-containing protein [Ramlibacter sp.]|uniref:STAS/SEC14 domain-containing protein n=1 Tax=Ramlibacter sp. TaxID=1917967 RepID=UPI003D122C2C
MSLILLQRDFGTHLWVRVKGAPSLDDLLSLVDEVAQTTRERGLRRLLVDLSLVESVPDGEGQTALGRHVAKQMAHLERMASVVPSDKRTGNSERAARAEGMQLQVFVDEEEARGWLLED